MLPRFAALACARSWGVLRGLETFSQLVSAACTVPGSVTITDSPRFPHRGIMIDSSRHFIPISNVLEFVDAMSFAKFNTLHWHLTDSQSFPVQSKAYPRLTMAAFDPKNGCRSPFNPMLVESSSGHASATSCTYSAADLRRVVAFAKDRGIRVVPEFDSPGERTNALSLCPEFDGPLPQGTRRAGAKATPTSF